MNKIPLNWAEYFRKLVREYPDKEIVILNFLLYCDEQEQLLAEKFKSIGGQ